jgi:hypothetical protein
MLVRSKRCSQVPASVRRALVSEASAVCTTGGSVVDHRSQQETIAQSTAAASKVVGAIVQLFSLLASIVMFVLVSVEHVFRT